MARDKTKITHSIRPKKVRNHYVSSKDGAKGTPCTMIIFKAPKGVGTINDDGKLYYFHESPKFKVPIDHFTGKALKWDYDADEKEFSEPGIDKKLSDKAFLKVLDLETKARLFGTAAAEKP